MTTYAADEMVPLPAAGRVFSHQRIAGLGDCAPSGRLRLDSVARWLQDVAHADVQDAEVADAAVWILRRTRIVVHAFPQFADSCLLQTFCSGVGRIVAERRTVISEPDGGRPLIDAEALWVHLNPDTHLPYGLTDRELEIFAAAGYGDRRVSHRLRHPRPEPDQLTGAAEFPWSFRHVDKDVADHINNAVYWEVLEEELLSAPDVPARIDAEVEFRDGAQPGPARYLIGGDRRWLLDDGGELLASYRLRRP